MPMEVEKMRRNTPIQVIVYHPQTEAGKVALSKRIAEVHATAVTQRLKSLHCPTSQKLELLDAVIKTVRERSRE